MRTIQKPRELIPEEWLAEIERANLPTGHKHLALAIAWMAMDGLPIDLAKSRQRLLRLMAVDPRQRIRVRGRGFDDGRLLLALHELAELGFVNISLKARSCGGKFLDQLSLTIPGRI